MTMKLSLKEAMGLSPMRYKKVTDRGVLPKSYKRGQRVVVHKEWVRKVGLSGDQPGTIISARYRRKSKWGQPIPTYTVELDADGSTVVVNEKQMELE